jgi:hypothetical protein
VESVSLKRRGLAALQVTFGWLVYDLAAVNTVAKVLIAYSVLWIALLLTLAAIGPR